MYSLGKKSSKFVKSIDMDLWSDFIPSSQKEWESKILKDLKGKSLDDHIQNTNIGKINPFIFKSDRVNQTNFNDFTSINADFDLKKTTNDLILKGLSQGLNSITLFNGDYSKSLLSQVMHDLVQTHILFNSENINSNKDSWLKWQADHKNNSGFFRYDPIHYLNTKGKWFNSKDIDLENWIHFYNASASFQCIYVDGSIFEDGSVNVVDQISYIAANLNEYFELLRSKKQKVIKVFIRTSIGTSYLLEIAKLRALRSVVSSIEKHRKISIELKIESITSNSCLSPIDTDSNLLRLTTSAMSSILGGSDIITILPPDALSDNKSLNSQRLATNIAHVLKEEALLDNIKDPLKGAYIIEEITHKLKTESWSHFKEIEEEGGWISYFNTKKGQLKCAENIKNLSNKIRNGQDTIVGFNKYRHPADKKFNLSDENILCNESVFSALNMKEL